jgi:hypothetical protein
MTWRLTWKPPSVLVRTGECLLPTDLSWRRAHQVVALGLATIDPHHQRWLGKLSLNAAGRAAIGAAA